MAKTYRLRTNGFYRSTTDASRRIGVEGSDDLVVPADDYVGELDDKQLEAVLSDQYLLVDEVDGKGNVVESLTRELSTNESEGISTEVSNSRREQLEHQDDDTNGEDGQGDDPTEPDLESMNRDALNAHAASVGVEKPEELPTKADVKAVIQAASKEV